MARLPQQFGRYILLERIGEGGMAEVYRAEATVAEGLAKRIVIKKIRPDFAQNQEFTRMFVDEAKIALSLNHANIVQVFDFGRVRGNFYLAMELVEGLDVMRLFHSLREQKARFPAVIAAYIAHQVTAALAYAHRKNDEHGRPLGIVHRDVSPHNIMVSFEGEVKILDFGIARSRLRDPRGGAAELETIKGKVAYMSPEQSTGHAVDPRSDVYSVGVVLYELLTGELLFRGTKDRMAALERVRNEPIVPLREAHPDVIEGLARIVDRALERDPAERYQSARAMQADLAGFLHHADPVVDAEGLRTFVARFATAPDPQPTVDTTVKSVRLPELGDSQATEDERAPTPRRARVVLLHVRMAPALNQPETAPDPSRLIGLARDLAFKRDGIVLHANESQLCLVFGASVSPDDDADRAMRVASILQEEVAETAPGLRIGIAVASVPALVLRTRRQVDVKITDAVLQQVARIADDGLEGPILVTSNLCERVGRRWRLGQPRFGSAAPDDGDPDPDLDQAHPVLGLVGDRDVRARLTPGGRRVLVGRDLELKILRDAFSEAIRTRRSRHVLVLGHAGMGKRALIERFAASLPRSACWVLRGAGLWAQRNTPFGVIARMLDSFLQLEGPPDRETLATKLRGMGLEDADDVALALEAARAGAPDSSAEALWTATRRLLRGLAARRPVLLMLEQVHLFDRQTFDELREWLLARHPAPAIVLLTGRAGARAEQLRQEPNITTVELAELDPVDARGLITRRFEHPDDANALADAILTRTGGNPLYIEETLASLVARGVLAWNTTGRYLVQQRPHGAIDLPPSVEEALQLRLETLPHSVREVLQGAAVLGRLFQPSEVRQLLRRDIDADLRELGEHHLVELEGPNRQRIATVTLHETVRTSLAEEPRRRLHQRAARLVRERPDFMPGRDDGPVADHFKEAGDSGSAVEPALAAGAFALDGGSREEARHYFTIAIDALDDHDPRRFEALLKREGIERGWGDRRAQGGDIRAMLKCADALGDTEKEVIAAIRLLRFYIEVDRVQRASTLLPRLRERVGALPEPDHFRSIVAEFEGELLFLQGDLEGAQAQIEGGIAQCGDAPRERRQRARLELARGNVLQARGRNAEARVAIEAALDLAREVNDRQLEAASLNKIGEVAGREARYQEAVDLFRAALAVDREIGDRYATGRKLANLGMTYSALGLYRRAERYLRKAVQLHRANENPALLNDVLVHLGTVVTETGDPDEAVQLLQDAANIATDRGDHRTALRAEVNLAHALLARDDPGDAGRAEQLCGDVVARSRQLALRTSTSRALHLLAVIAAGRGETDAAIRHEREAVRLYESGAAPLDGVRSVFHLGKLLQAGGDPEGALRLQQAARIVDLRAQDLRDPDLIDGYRQQPRVAAIVTAAAALNDTAD